MKNDVFADIAAGFNIDDERGLISPTPRKLPKRSLKLKKGDEFSFKTFKKMDSNEELLKEVAVQRKKYAKFLQDLAPKVDEKCERTYLTDFTLSLDGGKAKPIKLPHYSGPLGEHTMVYKTNFKIKDIRKNTFIVFKAVDYIAKVFVNDKFVGSHEGFFAPFEFEITSYLKKGKNSLRVEVLNLVKMQGETIDNEKIDGDKIYAATGVGWDEPGLGWHHCPAGMGIYHDVFIETREPYHITDIFPRVNNSASELWVECNSCEQHLKDVSFNISLYGQNFKQTVFKNLTFSPTTNISAGVGDTLTEASLKAAGKLGAGTPLKLGKGYNRFIIPIEIKNKKIWDLETPYLYKVIVEMIVDGKVVSVKSRPFGIRDFRQELNSKPKGKFYLNNREIVLRGANTMGFEQQDVFKKDFERLIDDILLAKICNMNFLRITQRPVQEEIYDYCDRLGLMVQTDMPMFGEVRINKLTEVARQADEMEKLVRSHPCCIIDSYINEPFPNADNKPHRMLKRFELQKMFEILDNVVHLNNPERVTKHVDGDYDPPSNTLPDNHCYPMWYNGHGIEMGKLHKGYWLKVKPDWHYGCGEFGCEGLERAETMKKYYPKEWLKEPFHPKNIHGQQTAAFHYFFYETPKTMDQWISNSQAHQKFSTKLMTSAFRRNPDINTFAIHLFIDAFPAGWMKTIMDCDRNPKPAFFAYKECLSPVFCDIRSDRFTFFENENINLETYLAVDDGIEIDTVKYMVEFDKEIIFSNEKAYQKDTFQSIISLKTPKTDKRKPLSVYMGAFKDGKLLNYSKETFEIFPQEDLAELETIDFVSYSNNKAEIDKKVKNGETVFIKDIPEGEFLVGDKKIFAANCRMSSLYFVSRDTNHPACDGLLPNDLKYFYDSKEDLITPLIHTTFKADGVTPITITANNTGEKGWDVELACGEFNYGKGKFVINQMQLDNKEKNPCAVKLINNLAKM